MIHQLFAFKGALHLSSAKPPPIYAAEKKSEKTLRISRGPLSIRTTLEVQQKMQFIQDGNRDGRSTVVARVEFLDDNREKRHTFGSGEFVSVLVDGPTEGFGVKLKGSGFETEFKGEGLDFFRFQVPEKASFDEFEGEFFDFERNQTFSFAFTPQF